MIRILLRIAIVTLGLGIIGAPVLADVPHTMSYQGLLLGPSGSAVPDGNYSLTFKLYSTSSGGSALWSETQGSVGVSGGLFSVILGSATPLNLPFDGHRWLGITVAPNPELTPRIELASSPFALGVADSVVTSGKLAGGTVLRSLNTLTDDVTLAAGSNITITPAGNTLTISATGGGLTLPYSGSASSSSAAFSVSNTGSGSAGVFNQTSSSNATYALGAFNYSTVTNSFGVLGRIVSTTPGSVSAGVRGINSGTGNSGVGVYGSHSGGGWGVYGLSSSGLGVYGASGSGAGVTGTSNTADGVDGSTNSSNQAGVYGSAGSGAGVWGTSTSGTGVYAFSTAGYCLQAIGHFIQGGGIFEAYPTSTIWTTNKPATVKLDDGQTAKLFSEEATEVLFSDQGHSALQNGRAHIELDPKFRQTITVDATHPVNVVVQLEGDCQGVFVTNKTATGFDVVELQGGRSSAPFFYRVTGKRKYYEDERLATLEEDTRYNQRMLQTVWPEKVQEIDASRTESQTRLQRAPVDASTTAGER
jgi:hypothetical protein